MAEGRQAGPQGPGEDTQEGPVVPVSAVETQQAQPVVHPKETRAAPPVVAQEAAPPGRVGEWGQSPALGSAGRGLARRRVASAVGEWRERRAMEDDEGAWSYSTAPGQYTLDVLRERFGEAGHRGPSSRQHMDGWSEGSDPARFRLSSPRSHHPPAASVLAPEGTAASQGQPTWPRGSTEGEAWEAAPRGTPGAQGPGLRAQSLVTPAAPTPGAVQPTGLWGLGVIWGTPPIPITFDGNPD